MKQAHVDDSKAQLAFAKGFHEEDFAKFEEWGPAEVERRLTAGKVPFHLHNRERASAEVWLRKKGMSTTENMMNPLSQCNERVTVERQDSTRHENVPALVTDGMILIPDVTIPIAPGDAILRQLPSGLVDRLVVREPGFHAEDLVAGARYQIRYHREGQEPAGKPGYVVHVSGENARVNILSTDNSSNAVGYHIQDLSALGEELARLREALSERARSAEDYVAIGAIASAEMAAKSGERSRVTQALSALGGAGRWVLDTAKDIGVQVATDVLKAQIGL